MKARFTCISETLASEEYPGEWRCQQCGAKGCGPKLECCPECGGPVGQRAGKRPVGAELEHPDAWKLVRLGMAVPVDDECERRCCMSPAQINAAQLAHNRVAAGIHPDDYPAFNRGEMVGYNADGSPIPGPNYESDVIETA